MAFNPAQLAKLAILRKMSGGIAKPGMAPAMPMSPHPIMPSAPMAPAMKPQMPMGLHPAMPLSPSPIKVPRAPNPFRLNKIKKSVI